MGKNKRKPDIRFQGFTGDLHQRKLIKLQNIKKSMLEKMFV